MRVTRRPCQPVRFGGGKRGPIKEFTIEAQRRLLRTLYSIGGLRQQVGLTYPGRFPHHGDKEHIQAFCRWLKGRGVGGIWVMEFQQDRNAPHFHLLLNNDVEADDARRQWLKIIGEAEPLPASCAVDVEPIHDQYRIRSYVAKSSTKEVPPAFKSVGRFYGVFGPITRIPTIDCVSEEGLPRLIRALRTLDRKRRERKGWKPRRDSGRWSHTYGYWTDSEMQVIEALIKWANRL